MPTVRIETVDMGRTYRAPVVRGPSVLTVLRGMPLALVSPDTRAGCGWHVHWQGFGRQEDPVPIRPRCGITLRPYGASGVASAWSALDVRRSAAVRH